MSCTASPTIRLATAPDAELVHDIVLETIRACYPACYSPSVVDAFCRYHSLGDIRADIAADKVYVLEVCGRVVGTGTVDGSYLGRMYVLPGEQGKGYGSRIMDKLESLVAQASPVAVLDSSTPGRDIYLHRGYVVAKEEVWDIEQHGDLPADQLVYEVMEKRLHE